MPIDASYPLPLIEEILADAKPVAVCAQEDMSSSLPGELIPSQLKFF